MPNLNRGSAILSLEPYPLKRRSDLHLARKAYHILGVLLVVGIYSIVSHDTGLRAIALASFCSVIVDLSRQQWPQVNRLALRLFGSIMREHEREGFAGTTHLLLGAFLLIWFFPRPIVILTLLFLAIADPIASYIGIRYGKDKLIGSKSLQGSFAAFVVCTLAAMVYFMYTGLMTERLLIVSLLAGLSGALSELIPFGKLDDNFSFPVVSALALWLIFTVFGGLV
jgi:diacylglycerol kinase (CTP)